MYDAPFWTFSSSHPCIIIVHCFLLFSFLFFCMCSSDRQHISTWGAVTRIGLMEKERKGIDVREKVGGNNSILSGLLSVGIFMLLKNVIA
jgi:hypothetical protein